MRTSQATQSARATKVLDGTLFFFDEDGNEVVLHHANTEPEAWTPDHDTRSQEGQEPILDLLHVAEYRCSGTVWPVTDGGAFFGVAVELKDGFDRYLLIDDMAGYMVTVLDRNGVVFRQVYQPDELGFQAMTRFLDWIR